LGNRKEKRSDGEHKTHQALNLRCKKGAKRKSWVPVEKGEGGPLGPENTTRAAEQFWMGLKHGGGQRALGNQRKRELRAGSVRFVCRQELVRGKRPKS